MPILGFASHTQMISPQGQYCVHCALMDCLCLLVIHSFSGSSAFPSKGLNVPHISSRNMTECDCIQMTRMNELNGSYLFLSYFCFSQQVHKTATSCQCKWAWWDQNRPSGKFCSPQNVWGQVGAAANPVVAVEQDVMEHISLCRRR